MSDQPFKFKEFTIHQDRCAMKIGTDSVILGAWTSLEHQPESILDIGAGTGVLSLMLAQRSNAHLIDALEIDNNAYEQCTENFENSIWNDRLFCYHADLQEFTEEIDDTYDLIVCNPPFYSEDYKTKSASRDIARFNDAMPFDHLIYCVSHLLTANGRFNVVIPYKEEEAFVKMAAQVQLHPHKILHIKGHPEAEIKRSFMEFSRTKEDLYCATMVIETSRHEYTEAYVNLTKDFYLKM